MHPLQPIRESDLHSNPANFQGVKPQRERMRISDDDAYAHGPSYSFSSSTQSSEGYVEGSYQLNPSSLCLPPPQGFIPAFSQQIQNSSDRMEDIIQQKDLNEVAYFHNENHLYLQNQKQSFITGLSNPHSQRNLASLSVDIFRPPDQHIYNDSAQNFHQPPSFIGKYVESSPKPHWHHQTSTMLPFAMEPDNTVQNYALQNASDHHNNKKVTPSTAIPKSKGLHYNKITPQNLYSDEISMEESSRLRKYEYDKLSAGSLDKNNFFNVKDTQNEVTCISAKSNNSSHSGFIKGKEMEVKNEKIPVPQNLRGDPFRSAKVKTELCRHFGTKKGCPFGDKCNYAHGEHELKYTKLMDLDRAGLIDIEIYRTHPCPTWVATGACPFDSRCSGLHDPRLSGGSSSWLPHGETLMNRIGDSISNVDKLYHQRLSEVYSYSPIYEYVPLTKWASSAETSDIVWRHFYSYICNVDRPIHSQSSQAKNEHDETFSNLLEPIEEIHDKDQLFHLMIVLDMRKSKLGQSFTYMPTHNLRGELCMIIQSRRYEIIEVNTESSTFWQLNALTMDKSKNSQEKKPPPTKVIHAYEVAFGPVYDPSTRAVSIWFDIPPHELTICTPKEAKNHKRSRHRLKKCIKKRMMQNRETEKSMKDKSGVIDTVVNPICKVSHSNSFIHHQPLDKSTYDFVTDILKHRLSVLQFYCRKSTPLADRDDMNELKLKHDKLKQTFASLRRFWLLWSWPANLMEEDINNCTDVIPINIEYRIAKDKSEKLRPKAFAKATAKTISTELESLLSKPVISYLWESFLFNLSETIQLNNIPYQDKHKALDISNTKTSRLNVFRNLSLGFRLNKNSNVLTLNQACQKNEGKITIISICEEWENIEKNTLKKTHGSRLSHTSETQGKIPTTSSIVTEESSELNDV